MEKRKMRVVINSEVDIASWQNKGEEESFY